MWPRSEEERLRARHCGFVAFVNRQDAARAKDALNEREIMGYVLRIGWGKARATPPAPFPFRSHSHRTSPPRTLTMAILATAGGGQAPSGTHARLHPSARAAAGRGHGSSHGRRCAAPQTDS